MKAFFLIQSNAYFQLGTAKMKESNN